MTPIPIPIPEQKKIDIVEYDALMMQLEDLRHLLHMMNRNINENL